MSNLSKFCRLATAFLVLCYCFSPFQLSAQPTAGKFGLGIQFGEPSGLTLRIYQPERMSVDLLFAWDLEDFFYANLHGTWEKDLDGAGKVNVFYGPGLFVGVTDRNRGRLFEDNDDLKLGLSGTIGLNLYVERVEIYVRLTPRLLLIDRTASDLGGGLGFRFYL